MKITISRKSFIDALSIGGSMSGKSKTLPILDMAKVVIKDKMATISSFDGECAIVLRSEIVDNENDATFCLNTKDILAILKSLKDDVVELEVDGSVCVVKHAKGKMEIMISDGEDFPTPQKDANSVSVPMKSEFLLDWVRKAKNFVEDNAIRPVMGGVYLYYDGKELGCAATNAHKLYCDSVPFEHEGSDKLDAILTSKSIDALIAMIGSSESVNVVFSDNNIAFKTSNAMLLCRKIEGKYPAFKTIIPQSNPIKVEVSVSEFKDSINRALLMAGLTHLIKFNINGLAMQVESCDFDFGKKNIEEVACSANGEIMMGFNGEHLIDCLNALDGDSITMEMSESNRPIMFKEGSKTIILMPMRLS